MALVDVYGSLGNSRNRATLNRSDTSVRFAESVKNEQDKFEREAKSQEKAGGWGRLAGGGLSLLAGLLTGGMSIPLTALLAGGTSLAGQKIATAGKQPSIGKFNMNNDRDYNDMFSEGQYSRAGMDALTAGLLKYAGGGKMNSELGGLGKFNPYNLFKKKYDALGYYPEWLQTGLR